MEQFSLLRIKYPRFDDIAFEQGLQDLSKTEYALSATPEQAPAVTHCITAMRYLIAKTTGWTLPRMYIGNMPRRILDAQAPQAVLVPLEEGERGDLIFFHRKSLTYKAYMITHVGILIDEETFFHSTVGTGGTFERIDSRIHEGAIASCRMLTGLTDPRG